MLSAQLTAGGLTGAMFVEPRLTHAQGAAGDAVRNAVLGPEVADHPDNGRRVRHGYFTHRTMQRLRTSRSMTGSDVELAPGPAAAPEQWVSG